MDVIDVKESPDQFIPFVIQTGHSRFPVIEESKDKVLGILLAKDLLRYYAGEEEFNVRHMLRPAVFVPESKRLNVLLREFRANRNHMAIVVDEYGGVAGLITMEDLIEEIVGEIHDESELDSERVVEESKGVFVVPGSLELDALEEKLGVPLVAETDCTTVAGAVVELFGRLPSAGEKIEHGGVDIEVLAADRRRVQQLRIKTMVAKE